MPQSQVGGLACFASVEFPSCRAGLRESYDMRVLQIIPAMDSSAGAETSLAAVDPLLVALGFEVHLAVLNEHQSLVPSLRSRGVHVHDLSGGSSAQRLIALASLIRRIKPALLHASLFQAAIPTQVLSPLLGVPVVVTWASTPTGRVAGVATWKTQTVLVVESAAARLSRSRFHAVTDGVARTKCRELHVKRDRVRVAERGRDARRFKPADQMARAAKRAELGVDGDEFVLLAVGRQEPQKAYPLLVGAFDSAQSVGTRGRLLIAGRTGHASTDLEEAIAKARFPHRVNVLGQREDVSELLIAADAIACSSVREGAAGSLIEAMAAGIPVVAVQLDGLEGVLEDEHNALVVPRSDLSKGIRRLAGDPALRQRLGEEGRKTFLARFTLERSAEALAEVYRWAAR